MPVLMPIAILFVLWINYESMKTSRNANKATKGFWKREREASHIRNQDISSLNIVTFHREDLPATTAADYELSELFETLDRLSGKDFVNLSEYTNTDLKLNFGTGRYTYLIECDANYKLLMKTLDQLGRYYIHTKELEQAKLYLEYAINHQTDLLHTYEQLATIND